MKIKIIVFFSDLIVGILFVVGLRVYYDTSYDIVIIHSNFIDKISLAHKYFDGENRNDYEGELLCSIAFSAQIIDQYFDTYGTRSTSLGLNVYKNEYEQSYKDIITSKGYDATDFFVEKCDSLGNLK